MKRFNKQFREEAVKLVTEFGRPAADVADDLGIHVNTLHKWINQYSKHKDHDFPGSDNLRPEDEEVRQLKKMIADLQEENAILKKATAIFAKHQK